MNNEQNNNMNGGLNFGIPPVNSTPPTNVENNGIPGANVMPVGAVPVSNPSSISPVEVNPTPMVSIVDNTINNAAPANNDMLVPNLSPVIPEVSNVGGNGPAPGVLSVNNPGNLDSNLNASASNTFDIGLSNNASNLNQVGTISDVNSGITVASGDTIQADGTNNGGNIPLTSTTPNNVVSNGSGDSVVSVGSYLGHIILFSIPIVGFIMLLVKAFGSKSNKNISNLAKAQLLLSVIITVLTVVIMIVFGAAIFTMFGDSSTQGSDYDYGYDYSYDYDY